MNSQITIISVLIPTIVLCALSIFWVWQNLKITHDKIDIKINQLSKEIADQITAIDDVELVQTNAGREILIHRLTKDINNEPQKRFVLNNLRPILSSSMLDNLSPDTRVEIIKEGFQILKSVSENSKPPKWILAIGDPYVRSAIIEILLKREARHTERYLIAYNNHLKILSSLESSFEFRL
jgi:hypothetical protein